MWEQVKLAVIESEIGEKEPKSLWWNDEVNATVEGKGAAWNEAANESCLEAFKEERRKVKKHVYITAKNR